jgi:hypothetical protein
MPKPNTVTKVGMDDPITKLWGWGKKSKKYNRLQSIMGFTSPPTVKEVRDFLHSNKTKQTREWFRLEDFVGKSKVLQELLDSSVTIGSNYTKAQYDQMGGSKATGTVLDVIKESAARKKSESNPPPPAPAPAPAAAPAAAPTLQQFRDWLENL